jgi:hypothetical protein
MKRLVLAFAGLSVACASAPATTADRILGTWTCEALISGGSLKGDMTYAKGGKATLKLNYTGTMANQPVVAAGEADGTWELVESDAKIKSTIGNLNVTSVKVGESDVAPAMAQALIGPMLAGQSSTSAITLEQNRLTLTAEDGTVTNCTR